MPRLCSDFLPLAEQNRIRRQLPGAQVVGNTPRFALRNGAYCVPICAVLQAGMALMARPSGRGRGAEPPLSGFFMAAAGRGLGLGRGGAASAFHHYRHRAEQARGQQRVVFLEKLKRDYSLAALLRARQPLGQPFGHALHLPPDDGVARCV